MNVSLLVVCLSLLFAGYLLGLPVGVVLKIEILCVLITGVLEIHLIRKAVDEKTKP